MKLPIFASALRSADPHDACLWAGYAMEVAIEAGYGPEELPADAFAFAALWTYHGEQLNGGHGQYFGNTEGDEPSWRRAASLLDRIGLPDHHALLHEAITFEVANADRVADLYAAGQDSIAQRLYHGFDDRFADLERRGPTLLATLDAWLVRQPWIEVDQSDACMDRLRRLIPPHQLRDERHAAELRRLHAENHGANVAFVRRLLDGLKR